MQMMTQASKVPFASNTYSGYAQGLGYLGSILCFLPFLVRLPANYTASIGQSESNDLKNTVITNLFLTFPVLLELTMNIIANKSVLRKMASSLQIFIEALVTKGSFIRYISHEVRSPLNTVFLGLDILDKEISKLPSDIKGNLNDIVCDLKTSCDISLAVINEMLLFDKIEEGILRLEKTWMDAFLFIKNTISPFVIQAMQANVSIKLHLPVESIENAGSEVFVTVSLQPDEDRVAATFDGLFDEINNAGKYTLRIDVRDSGPGISKVISNEITNLHEGKLSVFSDGEGFGSTFSLEIPSLMDCHQLPQQQSTSSSRDNNTDRKTNTNDNNVTTTTVSTTSNVLVVERRNSEFMAVSDKILFTPSHHLVVDEISDCDCDCYHDDDDKDNGNGNGNGCSGCCCIGGGDSCECELDVKSTPPHRDKPKSFTRSSPSNEKLPYRIESPRKDGGGGGVLPTMSSAPTSFANFSDMISTTTTTVIDIVDGHGNDQLTNALSTSASGRKSGSGSLPSICSLVSEQEQQQHHQSSSSYPSGEVAVSRRRFRKPRSESEPIAFEFENKYFSTFKTITGSAQLNALELEVALDKTIASSPLIKRSSISKISPSKVASTRIP
eukprot:gene1636-3171_t